MGINANAFKDTEGLNFAVPMPPACSIVQLLQEGVMPSPPALPLIFATNDELDTHLTIAGNMYGLIPSGIVAGDLLETVNDETVFSPNEVRELLRGYTGTVELGLVRNGASYTTTIEVNPQEPILERDFILMDGSLITRDHFFDRQKSVGMFQIHSIAAGSRSEQSDLGTYQSIISVDGIEPQSLEHLYELLNGGEKLSLIMREWSDTDNFLYDYLHVTYTAQDVTLYAK